MTSWITLLIQLFLQARTFCLRSVAGTDTLTRYSPKGWGLHLTDAVWCLRVDAFSRAPVCAY